jgi:predicted membrane channel-forming protein YqfA (hemolysin III family)
MVSIYQSSVEVALMINISYHAFREYRSHYSLRTLQYIVIIIALVMNTSV